MQAPFLCRAARPATHGRRLVPAITLAALTVLGALAAPVGGGAASAATGYSVYTAEAETMSGFGAAAVADGGASKGQSILMYWSGSISRQSVTPDATDIAVRARGDQCQGAPQ